MSDSIRRALVHKLIPNCSPDNCLLLFLQCYAEVSVLYFVFVISSLWTQNLLFYFIVFNGVFVHS